MTQVYTIGERAMKITMVTLSFYFIAMIFFIIATYTFFDTDNLSIKISLNFLPSLFLFLFGYIYSIVLPRRSMDPITIFFGIISSFFVLMGLIVDETRSERLFAYAFGLMTFVGGFEAGKARQKIAGDRSKSAKS